MKTFLLWSLSILLLGAPVLEKVKIAPPSKWTWAYNIVYQFNRDQAQRYANVYYSCYHFYKVPIEILVGIGQTESHFSWTKIGDGGLSYGPHQVKPKFPEHIKYLYSCDYGRSNLYYHIKKRKRLKKPCSPKRYIQKIGYNIQVSAQKLRTKYNIYGSWSLAALAYGCGESSKVFLKAKTNRSFADNYWYVKKALRYY